jgi:hypothetical protein
MLMRRFMALGRIKRNCARQINSRQSHFSNLSTRLYQMEHSYEVSLPCQCHIPLIRDIQDAVHLLQSRYTKARTSADGRPGLEGMSNWLHKLSYSVSVLT